MEGLVSAREAARILGVTPRHVARLAVRGELGYEATPLGRLYARDALERRRARPPRAGRPPKRRDRAQPTGETSPRVLVFMEQATRLHYPEGQVLDLAAGRPYDLHAETARHLVERGYARRMGP